MLCPMLPNKNVLTVNFLDFKKDCIDKNCLNKSNLSICNLKLNTTEFRTNLLLSFDVINGLLRISDRPNVRFGRTVLPNFYCAVRPKWQNFFLQNTELFSYYIQWQQQPFIFLFCLMTHMYVALSLVFR